MRCVRVSTRFALARRLAALHRLVAALGAAMSLVGRPLCGQALTLAPTGSPVEGFATSAMAEFPVAGGGAVRRDLLVLVQSERGSLQWSRESNGAPSTFQAGGSITVPGLHLSGVSMVDGSPMAFDVRRGVGVRLSARGTGFAAGVRQEFAGTRGASAMMHCGGRIVAYVAAANPRVLSFTGAGKLLAEREVRPDSGRSPFESWRDKRALVCDELAGRLILVGAMTGEVCLFAVGGGAAQCRTLREIREVLFEMVDARTSRMRAPPTGYHRLVSAQLVGRGTLLLQHEVVLPGATPAHEPRIESRLVSLASMTVTWRSTAFPRVVAIGDDRAIVVRPGRLEATRLTWQSSQ